MIIDLAPIPKVLLKRWLKEVKDLPCSNKPKEQIVKYLNEGQVTEEDFKSFLKNYEEYGRKHFFLFKLPEHSWAEINPDLLVQKVNERPEGARGINGLGVLVITKNEKVNGNLYELGMKETVSVPKINKDETITVDGKEWAAITYEDVPINLFISVDFDSKIIEMKFDSVLGMKYQETRQNAVNFTKHSLGLEDLTSIPLSSLARDVEDTSKGVTSDLIVKVETDGGISGTIRLSRDEGDEGSVSELPGGNDSLDNDNIDLLQETFDIVWLASQSNGALSQNIKTTIRSTIGDIHFRQYVLKKEADYVLSNIKNAIR